MKHTLARLMLLLVLLVTFASCGTTIYRAKYTNSTKFTGSKKRYHYWHAHGARPRQHNGGYW